MWPKPASTTLILNPSRDDSELSDLKITLSAFDTLSDNPLLLRSMDPLFLLELDLLSSSMSFRLVFCLGLGLLKNPLLLFLGSEELLP